jgi:hypothetical protein
LQREKGRVMEDARREDEAVKDKYVLLDEWENQQRVTKGLLMLLLPPPSQHAHVHISQYHWNRNQTTFPQVRKLLDITCCLADAVADQSFSPDIFALGSGDHISERSLRFCSERSLRFCSEQPVSSLLNNLWSSHYRVTQSRTSPLTISQCFHQHSISHRGSQIHTHRS